MATPRPKVFRAVVDFSTAGRSFRAGDVVEGVPLRAVFGMRTPERFVISDQDAKRVQAAETPNPEQPASAEKE